MATSVRVQVMNETRATVDVQALENELVRVLKRIGVREAEWTVTVVNDRTMSALHARTMNLPTTTDVLTFDLRDPEEIRKNRAEGARVELDTVICRDEAARRAKELGHAVADELLLYCVHSLLHVQGYDDSRKAQATRMHAREDEILTALGIGAVYAKTKDRQPPRKQSRRTRDLQVFRAKDTT